MPIPGIAFPFPPAPPSWYTGHMASFLSSLPHLLATTSIILEARDSRIPLTSVNPAFEKALDQHWARGSGLGKERLVVCTKRDLGDAKFEEPLKQAFKKYTGQTLLFADTSKPRDVRSVLGAVIEIAKANQDTHPRAELLVVGMPNVGKSTLLNALRNAGVHKGKAFRTSSLAGLTRKLTGRVKIHSEPDIYVSDSPGIMVPYLGRGLAGAERGLKLALTAGIKEDLFDTELLASYMLYLLPISTPMPFDLPHPYRYLQQSHPAEISSNSVAGGSPPPSFLATLATRLGLLHKGGLPDTTAAAVYLLQWFRKGGGGRWTGDFENVGGLMGVDEGVRRWVEAGMGEVPVEEGSKNQERKRKREELKLKRIERWKRLKGVRAAV